MKHFVLGVDVGGTNIKLGLVDLSGNVISRTSLVTSSFIRNKNRLISALCSQIKIIISKNRLSPKHILGIGIGLPGLVDFHRGTVNLLVNIPGWHKVPLKKIIEQKIKIPAFLDNDVNVMALGEWRFGAARGSKNVVCLTLGTGVGGGLILDNRLYRGENFAAGELGHIPLNENGPP